MKVSAYLMAAFIAFGVNCKSVNKKGDASINAQFQAALKNCRPDEVTKNYKAYLVIPNSGCSGCISSAENMLKTSVDKSRNVRFVLTNIQSLKMLSYKMGFDVTTHDAIIVDSHNYFTTGSLKSIYPQIFLINNDDGTVFRKMEISPNEDGLRILEEQYLIK